MPPQHTFYVSDDVRLLLADDDDDLRLALADELREAHFAVDEARNGHEALAWLEKERGTAAIAVLDVRMPGTSGLDVLDAATRGGIATPIVVMTAFGGEELRSATLARGAVAFLDKPFEIETLVATLNGVLSYLSATWRGRPVRR